MPTPRTALGVALGELATASIDVSDGLLADACHIARASGVQIDLAAEKLPLSDAARIWLAAQEDADKGAARLATLGDDYEILFTAPATAVVTIVESTVPPTLALESARYEVREGEPYAVLTVHRSGAWNENATVDFSTINVTASQREIFSGPSRLDDFTTTSGTLSFRPLAI